MSRFAARDVFRTSSRWIDHSAEVSRRQAARRAREFRSKATFIAQCSIAAGVTYLVAKYVFAVGVPLYAPIAAILTLGMSYGQRFSRAAEITAGVAIGALVGELFMVTVGMGGWQVTALVALGMSIAAMLGASTLMINQAGIQGLVIAMLAGAETPGGRWFEALIGACTALLFAGLVPSSVLHKPQLSAARFLERLSGLVISSVAAIRSGDAAAAEDALDEARSMESDLSSLRGYAADSVEITTILPWYRSKRAATREVADALDPMDRAVRNARVLLRRGTISVQVGEWVPEEYIALMIQLARITDAMSACFGGDGSREDVRAQIWNLALRAARPVAGAPLSAEVIRAQVRSMLVDYYMVMGASLEQAQEWVRRADLEYEQEARAAIEEILDDLEPETGALPAAEFTYTGILPVVPEEDQALHAEPDRTGTTDGDGDDATPYPRAKTEKGDA